MVDNQHGKQIFREAALHENLRELEPAAGAIAGMLEQHAIAGHQIGDGVADDLIGGEIPRLDPVDHADRRKSDDAACGVAGFAFLVGELGRAVGSGVVANRGAQLDLAPAVLDELADLVGHQLGELFLVVAQRLSDVPDHRGALFERLQLPFLESRVAGLDLTTSIVPIDLVVGCQVFAGGRIDGGDRAHGMRPLFGSSPKVRFQSATRSGKVPISAQAVMGKAQLPRMAWSSISAVTG